MVIGLKLTPTTNNCNNSLIKQQMRSDSSNADLLISIRENIQKLFIESDDAVVSHAFDDINTNINKM